MWLSANLKVYSFILPYLPHTKRWQLKRKRFKMKMKLKFILPTLIVVSVVTSCGNNSIDSSSNNKPSAYEMMETAFEGYPNKSDLKPMMESVMNRHKLEVNEVNLQKVGSMLVSLRKASKVGVTEMEILKHIYQNGSEKISLPDQAGISAVELELTK
jgi:cytochrome bd-type quinol oxidase subunit 1